MSVAIAEKTLTTEVAASIEQSLNSTSADYTIRKDALEAFRKLGFPPAKSEEYKFTPLTRVLEKNLKPGVSAGSQVHDATHYAIPGLDAHVLVVVNGKLIKNNFVNSPELTIQSLSDALDSKDELVHRHFAKVADHKADPFAAWNTAAWTDGVFIRVADNKVIEKPIVLYYVQDAKEGQVVAINRNLIVAGTNSEVTIIEKFDSSKESSFNFSNTVNEVAVGENAGVNFYSIQNDQGGRHQFGLTQFYQTNHSRVNTFTFTLDGKLVRNNLHLTLDGEGIESHMYGLYLLTRDTLGDNHTVVDHRKPNSFSNELYKGIMDENSKGVFNGKIYVRPDAQKTNAFQANRNILLTDKATVNTKPQLEIWADDVKCSHGCTSGQLDEEALFYLQTRGIHKETAQAMMLYAFAGELLESVKNPVVKEYLDAIISERLHKNF